jgi:signal transduction histidine kinase
MTSPTRTDLDFQALFDAAPGIYLVLDANFNMVAANEARLRATMTTRDQVIGANVFDVFPDNPDDPAADGVRNLRASLERVLQTKAPDAMAVQKYDIPRPEAQGGGFEVRYWSPLNTPVLGPDGAVKYIIHRVEDVTDFMRLKQQEARLQSHADRIENEIFQRAQEVQEANRKLEAANAELAGLYAETRELAAGQQRFFSQVSHELRTPLTLILGPLENLLANGAALEPQQRRELETIARNARTLLRHVNDLLDVVKYRSGSFDLAYARVDLAERVRVAAAHFDSASTGRAITLSVQTPEALEGEVDPERVDRILINLLSNAYKFTPEGGEICCELACEGQNAIITVADTGPGVLPHLREAIFEPFRQGDEGLTRRASGTGLGLAIVRDFLALHGGSISVGDAPAGGAVFACRLPLRAPAGIEVRAEPSQGLDEWNFRQAIETHAGNHRLQLAAHDGEAPLVLVVEDNRDMAEFIARTLGGHYRIATAGNGREGLRKAEELAPDLIISDLMMPEMSGDQLVAALAHRPNVRDTPVLLLTARADEETRIGALRQGVGDFLAKPFSVDELRARVDNLVRAKRATDLVKRGKQISDERYARLMDGARDGVFILTAEGVILAANRQAATFCARPAASLIGIHIEDALDLHSPAGRLELDADVIRDLESGGDGETERRCFEASSAAVGLDGQSYRLLIVRDVTEQRGLEAQLRRVQKLDALGQLTGGIAHDFNNLLTVVAANAEALLARLQDRPDAAALAANIERAADNGSSMTRRLLAFARRQEVELRLCDLNAMVLGAVEMLRRTLPASIRIETELTADAGPVLIDPGQLDDAILNLAINARDAMPQGGVLSIAVDSAIVGEHAPTPALAAGAYVRLSFTDTGEGMSKQVMARAFEPFFTTKGEGRGTGLGLSMVYGFARHAGGDVLIESTSGEGTRVTIYLPHAGGAAAAENSPVAAQA